MRSKTIYMTGPGSECTSYVYDAMGQLAAEYSTAATAYPCATCYLSYDHLGTVRVVTDEHAWVIARHDYLPFGEEIPANTAGRNGQWGAGNDAIAQKSTGQERDSETGIDYFNARYFGAALGRFTSPDPGNAGADPANPQSWNGYVYVLGNPLANVDPDGLSDVIFDGSCKTITVIANVYNELGQREPGVSFNATNNIAPGLTIGKLVNGTYTFMDTSAPHHHSAAKDSTNGPYGPGGIFRIKSFKGPDGVMHPGVGIHAGRASTGGYKHVTNGCVRTTESAISYITWLTAFDPLTTLTVVNNRPPAKATSSAPTGSASSTIRYGIPGGNGASGWGPFGWSGFDLLQFLSGSSGNVGGDGGGNDWPHYHRRSATITMSDTGRKLLILISTGAALLLAGAPADGQRRVLLDDSKAQVAAVNIPPAATYAAHTKAPKGAVWIAVGALEVTTGAATRTVLPGDAGTLPTGASLDFRNVSEMPVRLIVINVKSDINEPTVQTFGLAAGQTLEEASEANETLLVAVSGLKLRDVWNLEEDEGRPWRPSKPVLITIGPGDVRWVRAGTHEFTNLLSTKVRFVTIEW